MSSEFWSVLIQKSSLFKGSVAGGFMYFTPLSGLLFQKFLDIQILGETSPFYCSQWSEIGVLSFLLPLLPSSHAFFNSRYPPDSPHYYRERSGTPAI